MTDAVAPTRSRRLRFWTVVITLMVCVVGGPFILLWIKLPSWAPESVVEHSPWAGPIVRAVQAKPALFDTAVSRLGQLGQRVVPAMIDLLDDSDRALQRLAIMVLGNSRDVRAVPPLLGVLSNPDPDVVVKVVEALGTIGDGRAAGPLLQLFERLGHDPFSEDFMKWASIGLPQMKALANLPASDVASAILPFPAGNAADMEWRTEVAANVKDARVVKALEAVLWESDPTAGTSNDSGLLRDRLRRDRGVLAASALVKSVDQSAVEILVRASTDPDPWVRYRVYHGIVTNLVGHEKQMDPRLGACVEQALNDPDQRVRRYAAWAAQAFHLSQQAELRLLEISRESPPDMRWAAIRGLATPHASERALVRLAEALADPDSEVRRTTMIVLQRVKTTKALGPMFACFPNVASEQRAGIIWLFSAEPYRNDPQVVLFLLPLVEDPDDKIRSAAEQVLRSFSLTQEQREEKSQRMERFQARRPGQASGIPTSP